MNNSSNKPVLRVAYILAYRSPNYIRTLNILDALSLIPNIRLYQARNRQKGIFRYVQTLVRLIWIRIMHNPDIYILGFRGHEIFWLVRVICFGKALIFDSLMSPYSALKHEQKLGRIGVLISKVVFILEKSILTHSSLVLTDTSNHADFIAKTFAIEKQKIIALPMAAVESIAPSASSQTLPLAWRTQPNALRVLFYGSFLPLHGVDIIMKAIASLDQSQFAFHFVGGDGERLRTFEASVANFQLNNVSHERWVSFEKLLQHYIVHADLCLGGPFGNTPQSSRVVTGKSVQCLALGKATVIGRIDTQFPFRDRENCLLVEQGNPESLRQALQWAAENRAQLDQIGKQGQQLYSRCFSIASMKEQLQGALYLLMPPPKA